jgi:polysaccharide chain length determinant protein (PEP-CTERM system associated)
MGNLDVKFYLSIFLRRLPYFLVIAAFLSAVGIAVASILPPIYRSSASILVESQQIPGELAQSTVPINPIEQIQIIEQRLMTRANLLTLASRFDIYADQPNIAANAIVDDMRSRTLFTPVGVGRGPGATIFEISFSSESPGQAAEITNELVTLVLQENVSIRTDRAGDTLDFFQNESKRLSGELDRLSQQIMRFKSENSGALPDSLTFRRSQQALNQERLLQLEREETALKDSRERVIAIYERTGRLTAAEAPGTQEERDLEQLRRRLLDAQVIYSPTNPNIRLLQNRIAALEKIVEEQRALEGDLEGMSELDIALAETDGRLEFIAEERARIEAQQAELEESIKATPANELALGGLQRDYANTQRQYNETVASLSQAAIGERIEVLSKGERFTLIEPAVAPAAPEQPNRVLIAGAGVGAGIGAGLGFVVLLELLNRSIRRPSELSSQLGIQPFATIPYIRTQRETRWKRGILTGTLFLIAVAIPAGLFALHTWYLPLDLLIRQLLEKTGLGAAFGLAL